MTINTVREALNKQPFRPFSFRLADGRELPVPHPDFVAVTPHEVIVINAHDESWAMVEAFQIISIDYPLASQASHSPQRPDEPWIAQGEPS